MRLAFKHKLHGIAHSAQDAIPRDDGTRLANTVRRFLIDLIRDVLPNHFGAV